MIVLNVYCVRGRVDSLIACGKPRSRVADFIAKHYCGQLLIFDFFHVCMGGLDYPALRLSVYLIILVHSRGGLSLVLCIIVRMERCSLSLFPAAFIIGNPSRHLSPIIFILIVTCSKLFFAFAYR